MAQSAYQASNIFSCASMKPFWLADNYCLQGRGEEAHALFERMVGLRNDVGLLSEEYDPSSGRLLGNFPQAFSHIALVNTAMNLTAAAKPAEQRSESPYGSSSSSPLISTASIPKP